MDKLKLHSPDFTDENIKKIAELFPDCVTEDKDEAGNIKKAIDFDLLRQELSKNIVEGPRERYSLNWPGKREALLTANAPIARTLRPCREESVDFDTTQNLFIEGDNLDALKLMQETYLGKIKMIYIDPPYNTGNDFIYEDDFAETSEEFLKRSNQKDEEGNRLVANTESNGRFHSDWLSMMYPRLKLARNLLRNDGVIFISIDDGEVDSLKKMCEEIFGENNFVANIIWQKKYRPQNDAVNFSTNHDFIVCIARKKKRSKADSGWVRNLLPRDEKDKENYGNPDDDPRGSWGSSGLMIEGETANCVYEIKGPTGKTFKPDSGKRWSVSRDTFDKLIKENRIWFGKKGDASPRVKRYLSEIQNGIVPSTLFMFKDVGHTGEGKKDFMELFDREVFSYPKPVRLILRLLTIATNEDDIVLDFFAGSATTAHAVMKLNAEDSGNRKFIMVQLPEICDEKSEAFKAGYKTIADIGKERIRRAGKKIKEENATTAPDLDIGFRVFKVDSSNMQDVYYNPDDYSQDTLFKMTDNIKPDRTDEDLLFQVLLDWGVDLSLPVSKEKITGNDVSFVSDNALAACFVKEGEIAEDFCRELAKREPLRIVFRDAGFKDDSVKINVEQIFKLASPHTEIKTI